MKKLLKLVMIGSLPVDLESVKGGVEAVILNLLSGFNELDEIHVTHLSFNKDITETTIVEISSSIKIIFIPFKLKYDLPDYFFNAKVLNEILKEEKPDLIHIQEITPQILRFFSYSKDNIVVTQHGIMKEEIKYAEGLRKLKCLFKLLVEQLYFPHFKNLVFISSYNKSLFRGKINNSVKIYNPVNPIFFKEADDIAFNNSLLYVGVINRRKNLIIVLEAIYALKERNIIFKLHIVGGFKDKEYEKEIKNCIEKYQLSPQITFHGWRKQEEILEIYQYCPIFILPSKQETLPVSIGEAMALGKVVIASDVGAISEMFRDNHSGFLFRKDRVIDIVKILEMLHNNVTMVKAISTNAKNEALNKFHPSLVAKKTLVFYKDLINQS